MNHELFISPATFYDDDAEKHGTKVGVRNGDLMFTAWGKTEKESKDNALELTKLLTQTRFNGKAFTLPTGRL